MYKDGPRTERVKLPPEIHGCHIDHVSRMTPITEYMRRSHDAGLMLGQRRRRWASIIPPLCWQQQCVIRSRLQLFRYFRVLFNRLYFCEQHT